MPAAHTTPRLPTAYARLLFFALFAVFGLVFGGPGEAASLAPHSVACVESQLRAGDRSTPPAEPRDALAESESEPEPDPTPARGTAVSGLPPRPYWSHASLTVVPAFHDLAPPRPTAEEPVVVFASWRGRTTPARGPPHAA